MGASHRAPPRVAGRETVTSTAKKRGDGLERRPPAGIARERETSVDDAALYQLEFRTLFQSRMPRPLTAPPTRGDALFMPGGVYGRTRSSRFAALSRSGADRRSAFQAVPALLPGRSTRFRGPAGRDAGVKPPPGELAGVRARTAPSGSLASGRDCSFTATGPQDLVHGLPGGPDCGAIVTALLLRPCSTARWRQN